MISIRTERLLIVVFDSDEAIPDLRHKGDIKGFLKSLTGIEGPSVANEDGEAESRLQIRQDMQCLCFSESDNVQVGVVSSCWNSERGVCYMGFWIYPQFRGIGFATEAALAVRDLVFSCPDVKGIISETFSDWDRSIRVMEKIGLSRVDTDVGPAIVRYALAKGGSSVDFIEKRVITLQPFRYPTVPQLIRYFRWQWWRGDLLLLIMLAFITLSRSGEFWRIASSLGLIGYVIYFGRRLAIWMRPARAEILVQLREGGMFWATRNGSGGEVPWRVLTRFRLPNKGGLEIWNGHTWYRIPRQAFANSPLELTQAFLSEHGVVKAP
jgi:hypothetical protein